MAQANWPNFLIVGAASSGTTSIYTYLKQHPEVFLPALKEPHYFAQLRPAWEQRYLFTYVRDESEYLSLFSKAVGFKAIGEASPSYLWCPEAPARIYRAIPEARIIILLRDPVERAYSHYLMNLREGLQRQPFFQALEEDFNRSEKGWGISQLYIELGLYAAQVRRYLDTFGPAQVRVVMFEELRRSAESKKSALAGILNFIGVDPAYLDRIDTSYAENSFGVARWAWAQRLAGSNWARRAGQILVPKNFGANHTIKRLIFQRFFVKSVPRPEIDPTARQWLCEIFDPDLRELEATLGRELPELRRSWTNQPAPTPRRIAAV
jgi:hypothetical protein